MRISFFVFLLLFCPVVSSWGLTVPLESWVYPAIDRLTGFGVVQSALVGSRPYSRAEVGRLVVEADHSLDKADYPFAATGLVERLKTEFSSEIRDFEMGSLRQGVDVVKPLQDVSFKYVYQEGEAVAIADRRDGFRESRIRARQTALNYNNYGIEYREHANAQLSFSGWARFWDDRFSLEWRPLLELQESDGGPSIGLLNAVAAVKLAKIDLSFGRQSLWWGQGRHGSLILTNNAKPLDMLRLTNESPVLLPWIFSKLGPFRFDFFLTELESDRVVPNPYLGGLRVDFKPAPWLELGGSRAAVFGGDGRPGLRFDDVLYIIGGENVAGRDNDTSNQLAAIDGRLRLPFLYGVEVYGEWGGEDQADLLGIIPFFSNMAYLVGLYVPRLDPQGFFDLTLEYADLSHIDDNSPLWYRHGIYQSGYTYQQKILGHHAGSGAEDFFMELGGPAGRGRFSASVDFENRGSDQPLQEKHTQISLGVNFPLHQFWDIDLSVSYEKVTNSGYIDGNDQHQYLATAGAKTHW